MSFRRFIVASLVMVAGAGPLAAEPQQLGAAAIATAIEEAARKQAASEGVGALAPTAGTTSASESKPNEPSVAAPVPPPPPAPTLLVDIDLTRQRMTVTENGKSRYTWPVSSGREGYRTPTGTFRPQWMAQMWYSKQYDDAPMPHSIFIKGGVAIHATYATGLLGRPASHGCIRLAPANAATLYKMVSSHGKAMTRVKVHGVAKDTPAVAARPRPDRDGAPRYANRPAPRPYYAPPRYSPYGAPGFYGYAQPRYIYPGDGGYYGTRPARPYAPSGPYAGPRVRYYYD